LRHGRPLTRPTLRPAAATGILAVILTACSAGVLAANSALRVSATIVSTARMNPDRADSGRADSGREGLADRAGGAGEVEEDSGAAALSRVILGVTDLAHPVSDREDLDQEDREDLDQEDLGREGLEVSDRQTIKDRPALIPLPATHRKIPLPTRQIPAIIKTARLPASKPAVKDREIKRAMPPNQLRQIQHRQALPRRIRPRPIARPGPLPPAEQMYLYRADRRESAGRTALFPVRWPI
jgi:hypothetical protein